MIRNNSLDNTAKSFFIVTFLVLAFYFFGSVLMPIVFSGIASLILLPIVKFFERIGLGRAFSVFLTVFLILILLSGLILVLIVQSQAIVTELPVLMKENKSFLSVDPEDITMKSISNLIGIEPEMLKEYFSALKGGMISVLEGGYKGVTSFVVFLITCPIYIFFMLMYRNNVYKFIIEYQKRSDGEKDSDEIIEDVKHNLFQYLKGMLLVMFIVGLLTYLGLLLLGIKYALFLGILTALLTPLPYIGVIISAAIPIIIAILTKDSGWYSIGVLGVFAVVQFLEGNLITPKIMGNNVNINPLVIIISLVLFGAVSGLLGLILTVPLLAVIKVIIEHSPNLKPWKYLFEDKKL
ncbi:MAG TPA: AI-2E family transporter [Brumimicrobium sp.]|nr:AI-2E family transporter [Brumimicrobium sp.]